jgi:hypothetical protein
MPRVSDTSGAFPPPPPPSIPPPVYGAPPPPPPNIQLPRGYKLPPGYQGPTAPDYAQPYQQQPWAQQPQPTNPGALAFGSASAIAYQFGGRAIYANIAGVAAIVAPFAFGFYFPILPIFGFIAALRALQAGRLLGGLTAMVLNAFGAIVSLWASGLLGF